MRSQTILVLNQIPQNLSTVLTFSKVDEYGFVIVKPEDMHDFEQMRYGKKIGLRVGRGGYRCKDLCRQIPKRDSRYVSYHKSQEYFCATCDIAMKCHRCRCCGRLGRAEPRGRHKRLDRKETKFVD